MNQCQHGNIDVDVQINDGQVISHDVIKFCRDCGDVLNTTRQY